MHRVYLGSLTDTNIVSLVHAVIDTQTYLLQLKIKNQNQCFLSLKYIVRKKKKMLFQAVSRTQIACHKGATLTWWQWHVKYEPDVDTVSA